jgi:hypothetical protein
MQEAPLTILEPTDEERQAPWFHALDLRVGQRRAHHVLMAMEQLVELRQVEPDESWAEDDLPTDRPAIRKLTFRFSRSHDPHTSPPRPSGGRSTSTIPEGGTFSPLSPADHHASPTSPQGHPTSPTSPQGHPTSPHSSRDEGQPLLPPSPPPDSSLPHHSPHQVFHHTNLHLLCFCTSSIATFF